MDIILISILIFSIIIIYFLVTSNDNNDNNDSKEIIKTNEIDEEINNEIYIIAKDSKKVLINDNNRALYLTNKESLKTKGLFLIHPKKRNNIILQSNITNKLVSINYTISYNNTYPVVVDGCNFNNNSCKLKLLSKGSNRNIRNKGKNRDYYIKFFNNYYMCVDSNGIIYASKDKTKIFYFTIKKNIE